MVYTMNIPFRFYQKDGEVLNETTDAVMAAGSVIGTNTNLATAPVDVIEQARAEAKDPKLSEQVIAQRIGAQLETTYKAKVVAGQTGRSASGKSLRYWLRPVATVQVDFGG